MSEGSARLAADRAGLPLHEAEVKRELAMRQIGAVAKAPFPFPSVGDPDEYLNRVEFARSQATVCFRLRRGRCSIAGSSDGRGLRLEPRSAAIAGFSSNR